MAAFPRSSYCASALALALLLAGCGGHGGARRAAVNRYFDAVDGVQRSMVSELSRVNVAYQKFSTRGAAASARQLAEAERTLRTLRERIRRLAPPEDAAPIHRDLLRLLDADVAMAHELSVTARFLPAFARARAPAVAAGRRMRAGLAVAKRPAAQAQVLERYASDSEATLRRLERLHAPKVLAPAYRSELETVRASASISSQLAGALRQRDVRALPGLNARFQALSGGAIAYAGANAEALAISAYTHRLEAIGRLQARIQRERLRLQNRLG